MIVMPESLFMNVGVLEQAYLPRLLPYREEQQKYIAECIKPLVEGRNGVNLFISGSPGIGKTACLKYILRELKEKIEDIAPVYVNCWKRDTTPKIANEIARELGIKLPLTEKLSSDQIFDMIIKNTGKFKGIVFVFDEIDKTQDYDFLYRIVEDVNFKAIFLVTNVIDWISKLDRRLISRILLERLEFKPYSFEEIRGILREREQYAFIPNSWDYEAFEIVIRKTHEMRDLRVGLFLMKRAGEFAEKRNANKIEIQDVEEAVERLKDLYSKESEFI